MTDLIHTASPQDSIEITRTSKGACSYTVKVYGTSPKEIRDKMRDMLDLVDMTEARILSGKKEPKDLTVKT